MPTTSTTTPVTIPDSKGNGVDTTNRQTALIIALRELMLSHTTEHNRLDIKLDQTHHAFVMREWGENKQLQECLKDLERIIQKYDPRVVTINFAYNHPTITATTPFQYVSVENRPVTLPSKPADLTPPTGKVFLGWNTAADGSGHPYKAGEKFITPAPKYTLGTNGQYTISGNQITLYAYWGTDWSAVAPTTPPASGGATGGGTTGGGTSGGGDSGGSGSSGTVGQT